MVLAQRGPRRLAQQVILIRRNLALRASHGGEFPLPQLVTIDDCARSARHIVEGAALDKRVYARVTEQDQRRTIVKAARISGDLPSLREQLFDRQRCLRCRQAGRRRSHDGGERQ
jgi:hypothetical protein